MMKLAVLIISIFISSASWAQLSCGGIFLKPGIQAATKSQLRSFWNPRSLKKLNISTFEKYLQDFRDGRGDLVPVNSFEGKLAAVEFARRATMDPQKYRQSIIDEIANLKKKHRQKIVKLLNAQDFANPYFQESISEFSSKIYFLLKGFPNTTTDLLWKTSDERFRSEVSQLLGEQVLAMGLKKVLTSLSPRMARTDEAVLAEMKTWPVWNLLKMPRELPKLGLKPIPDQIIERAVLDGEASVLAEVEAHFRAQKVRYTYQKTVRPLWKVAFLTLMIGYGVYETPSYQAKFETAYTEVMREKASQVIAEVSSKSDALAELNVELSQQIFIKYIHQFEMDPNSQSWEKAAVSTALNEAYGSRFSLEKIDGLLQPLPEKVSIDQIVQLLSDIEVQN
jgi:hypothetical protein